jgi:hypothetical protein
VESNHLPARARGLLEVMAEHRFVGFDHARVVLGLPTAVVSARLRALQARGYIRRERPFGGEASFFLITAAGLRAVGSQLPAPRLRFSSVEHDLGLAWLWLAARAGALGPLREPVSERQMRSRDATAKPGDPPLGVRLGGVGAAGRARLHYPDLLLITEQGKRVAIELELSAKGRSRRDTILGGYAADVRIATVLYLVGNRALGRSIQRSANSMGIEHLVRVRLAHVTDRLAVRTGGRATPARELAR